MLLEQPPVGLNMDGTSGDGEEESSVKSLISNMASMMTALTIRMDDMDGSHKEGRWHIPRSPPTPLVAATEGASGTPPSLPGPYTSQERLDSGHMGCLAPYLLDFSDEVRARVTQRLRLGSLVNIH